MSDHKLYFRLEHACILLLKCPVVVDPLDLIWATLDNIPKLVSGAIDLLTIELHHNYRVVLHEFKVYQLNLADIQDSGVCTQPLQLRNPQSSMYLVKAIECLGERIKVSRK